MKKPQILGLAIIFDIIIVDQLSKWWITEYILRPLRGEEPVTLWQWIIDAPARVGFASVSVMSNFNLTMVWNEGVSFGMMQGSNILFLTGLALVISAILLYCLMKSETVFEAVSYGMIIGGAMGNVIDRLRFGAVADFFDVYVGTYHWPAFNIADACITIGVVFLLVQGLFMHQEDPKSKKHEKNNL